MKCDMCYDRTSVGHEADVRNGLPEPGAVLRHARGDGDGCARNRKPVNTFQFGRADDSHQGQHDGARATRRRDRRRDGGDARARDRPRDLLDDVFEPSPMEVTHDSSSQRGIEGPRISITGPRLRTAARSATSRSGGRTFPSTGPRTSTSSRRELVKFMVLTSCGVRRRTVLDRAARAPSARPASLRRPRRSPASDELPIGGAKTFTYPDGSTPRLARADRREPASSPTTSSARTCCARSCPPSNWGASTARAMTAGSTSRPAGRWPGPPRRPLPRILVEMRDSPVYATGVEESHDMSRRLRMVRAPAADDRQRHARLRGADRHPAVLAADGHDERLSRRRHRQVAPGRAGQPRLPRPQRRAARYLFGLDKSTDDRRRATAWTAARRSVAGLFPGYFALVMATGIVSIAAHAAEHAAHRAGAARASTSAPMRCWRC